MPKGSNPTTVIARMLIDAQRLDRWARSNGTTKQREFADNMLKVCLHAPQIFIPPAVSPERSETWLMGEAAGHVYNETGVRQHPLADVDIHEWHAGFFSSAIEPKG